MAPIAGVSRDIDMRKGVVEKEGLKPEGSERDSGDSTYLAICWLPLPGSRLDHHQP